MFDMSDVTSRSINVLLQKRAVVSHQRLIDGLVRTAQNVSSLRTGCVCEMYLMMWKLAGELVRRN